MEASLNDLAPSALVHLLSSIEFQTELLFWMASALALALFVRGISRTSRARYWWAATFVMLFAFFSDCLVYRVHIEEVCSYAGFYEHGVQRPDVHVPGPEKLFRQPALRPLRTGPHGAFELIRLTLVSQPFDELRVTYMGARWHWYLFETPLRGIGGVDVFTNCNQQNKQQ